LASEALANVSAGIDKMHKELKSLVDKVAKSDVCDAFTPPPKLYFTEEWACNPEE
jgi:hypothetical protein